jgi:hypothetical protein
MKSFEFVMTRRLIVLKNFEKKKEKENISILLLFIKGGRRGWR